MVFGRFRGGREQIKWLSRFENDHDNLRAALAWLLDNGEPENALRLAAALWLFWYMHGHVTEGRRWLSLVLEKAPSEPTEARAKALDGAGYLAGEQSDHTARGLLEESLRCARAVGSISYATSSIRSPAPKLWSAERWSVRGTFRS